MVTAMGPTRHYLLVFGIACHPQSIMGPLPPVTASTKPANFFIRYAKLHEHQRLMNFVFKLEFYQFWGVQYLIFYKIFKKIFSILIDTRMVFRYFYSEFEKFRLPRTVTKYRLFQWT
jgi:hypothetical protein